MKIVSTNGQLAFDEMKGSLASLPKTNRWVRMGDTLPWAEYEKVYNRRLSNDEVGASNKPGRMVIAALIIKHKMNLSGEETILAIQENPYMQYRYILTLINLIGVDNETFGCLNRTEIMRARITTSIAGSASSASAQNRCASLATKSTSTDTIKPSSKGWALR